MTPILFPANAITFSTYGIGALTDAVSCTVTKQGMMYELQMVYPVTGKRFSDISERKIRYAKPDQIDNPQPFRIYRKTKPLNGKVTIYARHISYDLIGMPCGNFTATSASDFAIKIKSNAKTSCPFTFSTNISKSKELVVKVPTAMRSLLGESKNTWQKTYGGELKFDGFSVGLLSSAGVERPVTIQYGVDIVDATVEENISEVYTGVLPFYTGTESNDQQQTSVDVVVTGDIQYASGTFDFTRIKPLDLSRYFNSKPTKAQVNSMAQEWLADNDIQIPVINLTLNYAQIKQRLQQYDIITVEIPKLGVSKKVKVIKTVFDVFRERYNAVEVGDPRPKLSGELFDASHLKTGTLPIDRIADNSITSSKYGGGSVKSGALADWSVVRSKLGAGSVSSEKIQDSAVTVTKMANGSVTSVKIDDGAVTGNKILDKAVALAKLSQDLQVFYADTIAAINIVAQYFDGDWLTITNAVIQNLSVQNRLTVSNTQYSGQSLSVDDNDTHYILTETSHTGYDSHGASYTYYTYSLTSGSGHTVHQLGTVLKA